MGDDEPNVAQPRRLVREVAGSGVEDFALVREGGREGVLTAMARKVV